MLTDDEGETGLGVLPIRMSFEHIHSRPCLARRASWRICTTCPLSSMLNLKIHWWSQLGHRLVRGKYCGLRNKSLYDTLGFETGSCCKKSVTLIRLILLLVVWPGRNKRPGDHMEDFRGFDECGEAEVHIPFFSWMWEFYAVWSERKTSVIWSLRHIRQE